MQHSEKFELPLALSADEGGLLAAAQDLALSLTKRTGQISEVFCTCIFHGTGLSLSWKLESVRDGHALESRRKRDILTGMDCLVTTCANLETENNIAMLKEARNFSENGKLLFS